MDTSMTDEERTIRQRLDDSVQEIRSALRRLPCIDELDLFDIEAAAAVVDEANQSLLDALATTNTLAHLRSASEEATMLVATSRASLGVVRELLTVLTAALDSRSAA